MKRLLIFLFTGLVLLSSCKREEAGMLRDYFVLRNKGADMPVWVEGKSDRKVFLVLLHGGPGGDAQVYNTMMTVFSSRMESEVAMVYWDQRGSGNSAGHFDVSEQSVATCTDDLDKLITVLYSRYGNDSKIFLMGHSWGGTLGTSYLLDAQRQGRVKGFIEVDGAHNFLGIPEIVRRFNEIGKVQISADNNTGDWQNILNYCDGVDTTAPSDADIIQLNQYGFAAEEYLISADEMDRGGKGDEPGTMLLRSSYNFSTAAMNQLKTSQAMFNELKLVNYTQRMNEIKLPCLFVWGKYDMVVPRELGLQAYNRCGATDKQFLELAKSGHSPMVNETSVFCTEVLKWISDRI